MESWELSRQPVFSFLDSSIIVSGFAGRREGSFRQVPGQQAAEAETNGIGDTMQWNHGRDLEQGNLEVFTSRIGDGQCHAAEQADRGD